jgi:transglutaminase-like putative cysteine protease
VAPRGRGVGKPAPIGRRYVYAGWVEFDPTNGIVGSGDLIRVAVVRAPRQAVPVSGSRIGFPSDALGMRVEADVTAADLPTARGSTAAAERRAWL